MKAKKKVNRWVLPAVLVILIVIVSISIFVSKKRQVQPQIEELTMRELVGKTPQERLGARNIDTNQATITKIENIEVIRQRYSGLLKDAKDGHYLVELPGKVFVYDFEHDEIISEFEFQRIDLGERAG